MGDQWCSGVDGVEVVFRLADPGHAVAGVRLDKDRGLAGDVTFRRVRRGWELRIPRPAVHRMEYKFELRRADGTTSRVTDPANPLVVGGPFGDKSWLPMPGYAAPDWIDAEPEPADVVPLVVADTAVGVVDVQVWAPRGVAADRPLPLLVAHDGPEFATYAGLTHWAGVMVAQGKLPTFRLALLAPGERDPRYAANPDYAKALTGQVLPAIGAAHACLPGPVLTGASLGALAALHAEWSHPGTFAGLFLQSGSFFTPETDPQEARFAYFGEVMSFVRTVLSGAAPSRPLVAMTCGTCEENAHNNRVLAARLRTLGLDVEYGESRDMHTFTGWRDVLDPGLTGLLRRLWRTGDGA